MADIYWASLPLERGRGRVKWLKFALHRTWLDTTFIVSLALGVLIIFAAPFAGAGTDYPPAGFADLDRGEASSHLSIQFSEAGFLHYDSCEELEKAVLSGALDCGVLIMPGLDDSLLSGNCTSALTLLVSPSTAMAEAYRLTASACLYEMEAPYISFNALSETNISRIELLEKYREYRDDGLSFRFEITSISLNGGVIDSRAVSVTLGAAALALFIIIMYSNIAPCRSRLNALSAAIGMKKAIRTTLLPQITVRLLLAILAAALGLLAASFAGFRFARGLILPAIIYAVLLQALSFLLASAVPMEHTAYIVLVVLLLAGLALCPIYTDAALLHQPLGSVRLFAPMYWLWLCCQNPLIMSAASVILLAASWAAFAIAVKKRGRFN